MSDFFSGIQGARFPDVVKNSGPLPPANGLPAPLHDTPDGRINYGSTLLGDLNPYAYGEPGTMSSQQGYQNHPHRMHKCIPPIYLPEPNGGEVFPLSHPVDDSDVAFCVKLDKRSIFASKGYHGVKKGPEAFDNFINLSTLNYILAGLQLCATPGLARGLIPPTEPYKTWGNLLISLDPVRFQTPRTALYLSDIVHIVQKRICPFGIVRGSEKQGGQNEMGYSAATWPVGFIAAMVIDGKDRNLNNYWHHMAIDAGDDLVFRLDARPISECMSYTLNHYYKGIQRRNFSAVLSSRYGAGGGRAPTHIWQLVPDKFDISSSAGPVKIFGRDPVTGHSSATRLLEFPGRLGNWTADSPGAVRAGPMVEVYWQHLGYWHIARTQVAIGKYGQEDYYYNDTSHAMYVNHLEATFAPMWCAIPWGNNTPGGPAGGAAPRPYERKGVLLTSAVPSSSDMPDDHVELASEPVASAAGGLLLEAAFDDMDARKRTLELAESSESRPHKVVASGQTGRQSLVAAVFSGAGAANDDQVAQDSQPMQDLQPAAHGQSMEIDGVSKARVGGGASRQQKRASA